MRFLKTVPSKLVLLAVSWSLNQDSSWASHAGFKVKATILDETVFSWKTMKKKRDLNLVLISRSEFLTTLTPYLTFHGTHQWNTAALKSKTAVWDRCLWSCLWLWVFLSDKCMFIILSRLSPWKMAEKCHALLPQVDFHKPAQTFLLCIWETWVENVSPPALLRCSMRKGHVHNTVLHGQHRECLGSARNSDFWHATNVPSEKETREHTLFK